MMDYSLLAGICRNSGELVVGIIDYIRTLRGQETGNISEVCEIEWSFRWASQDVNRVINLSEFLQEAVLMLQWTATFLLVPD